MKKSLKIAVSAACIASMAAMTIGCSSTPAGQTPGKSTAESDTPVNYKFYLNLSAPEYPSDGGIARKLMVEGAEKAGIKGFDYTVTLNSGKDFFTKLNLMASAGEVPDYFDIDIPTLTKFVDEGLVLPLDDLVKKSPNISKLIRKEDWDAVTFNGKIYAIPTGNRPESFNKPNSEGILIRKDWLASTGMKEPKTLDEFHDVLTAFTKKDPDKNGKDDTFGLGGSKDTQFPWVFGAFGVFPDFWYEHDGGIKQGMVLPETKQALAVLQQWFKEGLIDPEFPVVEQKQLDSKVVNGKVGTYTGQAFAIWEKNKATVSIREVNPKAELSFIAPPTGPQGKMGMPDVPPAKKMSAVNAKVKNPEKLFAYLDWSVKDGDDGGFLLREGIEGKHYTYDKAKNDLQDLVGGAEKYKDGFSNPIKFINITDRRWAPDYVRNALENSAAFAKPNVFWKTVPAQINYPDIKDKLWQEYFVKIVTGTWTVDKWDEFVQKYYAQGGKEIEKQANDEWKKTTKK
jgi:putative aldouronate transport system substrate-binding protein